MALPNISEKEQDWLRQLKETIQYCIGIVNKFLETSFPEIRKSCGLLPTDYGLSIGIDVGECLITDMRFSEVYKINYAKEYNAAREYVKKYKKNAEDIRNEEIKGTFEDIGGNITVIGRPIIGASRMVQIAAPYEIIINSYGGSNLYEDGTLDFKLNKKLDSIKDYKNCIEVYSVLSSKIEIFKKKLEVFSHSDCEQVKEKKVSKK